MVLSVLALELPGPPLDLAAQSHVLTVVGHLQVVDALLESEVDLLLALYFFLQVRVLLLQLADGLLKLFSQFGHTIPLPLVLLEFGPELLAILLELVVLGLQPCQLELELL